jgi:alginate export protein
MTFTRSLPAPANASCLVSSAATLLICIGATTEARANTPWTLQSALGTAPALKLSGSFRARYEHLDGQARPGFDSTDEAISLRTTLFAEYTLQQFRFGAEMYDSRVYIADRASAVTSNEVNALELPQLYVAGDFGNVLDQDVDATVHLGRLMINLSSRRLVAADDYRNTTSGYTGARIDLKRKAGGNATLLYTLPQRRLPDDLSSILDNDVELDRESSDLVLWGALFTTPKLAANAAVDFGYFRLNERDAPDLATRDRRLDTVTVRAFSDPTAGQFDFELEGAYQTGLIRASAAANAPDLDVAASFYRVRVGYQWAAPMRPRLAFEYDVASGDDSGRHYGRYDTLFGMRRADFSPSGIYATIGRTNLRSPGLRFEAVPSEKMEAFIMYRALWLESGTDSFATSNVRDATGSAGDFAGHQIDSRLRYWIVPQSLRFEANATWLAKGRFLREAPNAPDTGDTTYMSLNLLASF